MSSDVTNSGAEDFRRTAEFRQYLAAILVSLLGLCMGSTFGWTSPMQPLLTSDSPPVGSEAMDFETVAWLGSVNYFGSITGTFFWGTAADRFGRKTVTCCVAVPFILSWILILTAQNIVWLVSARIIAGIGNSGTIITVPFFISEIARDDLRGCLGTFSFIFLNLGIVISYIIGAYLGYYGLAICSLIIPVVFILTFIWLPETPLFLWKTGQLEKSKESLLWYTGGDTVECEITLSKYKDIPKENVNLPSFRSLVASRGATKALMIGVALWVAKQGTGIYPICSFAVSIFEMCGTSLTPHQAAIIMGLMQLFSGIFCSVLVDRLGRKILLIGSLLVISLSLVALGAFLFFFTKTPEDSLLGWLPIALLSLHVTANSLGIGPVASIITAEIFPPDLRGFVMSKLILLFCVIAFSLIRLFPTMKYYLKPYGCFWFYSICSMFFSLFFYLYLPETKGKPQTVILELLNK